MVMVEVGLWLRAKKVRPQQGEVERFIEERMESRGLNASSDSPHKSQTSAGYIRRVAGKGYNLN